jgi:hypothetical protein
MKRALFVRSATSCFSIGSASQQPTDFVIRRLAEIFVELSHAKKIMRQHSADDFVGFLLHLSANRFRCDWYGNDEPSRLTRTERASGGAHGCARGKSVVHENDDFVVHIRKRSRSAIVFVPSFHFLAFTLGGFLDRILGKASQGV